MPVGKKKFVCVYFPSLSYKCYVALFLHIEFKTVSKQAGDFLSEVDGS